MVDPIEAPVNAVEVLTDLIEGAFQVRDASFHCFRAHTFLPNTMPLFHAPSDRSDTGPLGVSDTRRPSATTLLSTRRAVRSGKRVSIVGDLCLLPARSWCGAGGGVDLHWAGHTWHIVRGLGTCGPRFVLLPSRRPRCAASSTLTQAELERLDACVNHDLNDYGEGDPLHLEYEVAAQAVRKLGETFGLDWQSALLMQ